MSRWSRHSPDSAQRSFRNKLAVGARWRIPPLFGERPQRPNQCSPTASKMTSTSRHSWWRPRCRSEGGRLEPGVSRCAGADVSGARTHAPSWPNAGISRHGAHVRGGVRPEPGRRPEGPPRYAPRARTPPPASDTARTPAPDAGPMPPGVLGPSLGNVGTVDRGLPRYLRPPRPADAGRGIRPALGPRWSAPSPDRAGALNATDPPG